MIGKAGIASVMRLIAYSSRLYILLGKRIHLLGRLSGSLHIDAPVAGWLRYLVNHAARKASNGRGLVGEYIAGQENLPAAIDRYLRGSVARYAQARECDAEVERLRGHKAKRGNKL